MGSVLKTFVIDDWALASSPEEVSVFDLARETNKGFGIIPDRMRNITVVVAENKPADSPLNNIFWKEIYYKPYFEPTAEDKYYQTYNR